MTIRGKSDSQLDAEAAVRNYLARGRSADPLTEWRAAAHLESPARLTSRHPASDEDGALGTQVGVDLSQALLDYLDGSRGHFPVHDALLLFDRYCRRNHNRWPDHRSRPVCAEIAWMVIRDRCSLQFAAERTEVTWTRAERLLLGAVEFVRRRQEKWVGQAEMSEARHDPATCHECLLADPERRDAHDRTMCAECRRRAAA